MTQTFLRATQASAPASGRASAPLRLARLPSAPMLVPAPTQTTTPTSSVASVSSIPVPGSTPVLSTRLASASLLHVSTPAAVPAAVLPTSGPALSPASAESAVDTDMSTILTPSVLAQLQRLAVLPESMHGRLSPMHQELIKMLPLILSGAMAAAPVPVPTPAPNPTPAPALRAAAKPRPKMRAPPQPEQTDNDNEESSLSDAPSASSSNPPVDPVYDAVETTNAPATRKKTSKKAIAKVAGSGVNEVPGAGEGSGGKKPRRKATSVSNSLSPLTVN
jgi:hypothetical protein